MPGHISAKFLAHTTGGSALKILLRTVHGLFRLGPSRPTAESGIIEPSGVCPYMDFPIATHPKEPRDHCQMLVLNRKTGEIRHLLFYEVLLFFDPGDCLVINNSRVIQARIPFELDGTQGEMLVSKWPKNGEPVLVKLEGKLLKRLERCGGRVRFRGNVKGEINILRFHEKEKAFQAIIKSPVPFENLGLAPLPPYILKTRKSLGLVLEEKEDISNYQCVYANQEGSIAAPTAGLHWTRELLEKAESRGIVLAEITLHIGFASMMQADAKKENLLAEKYEVGAEAVERIHVARTSGKRVFACGTSAVRTLETLADKNGLMRTDTGATELFIRPGYSFKAVDALITNFHLPDSTNFLLTQAFVGPKYDLLDIYQEAVRLSYRFFSFGDAMLIL